MLGQFTFYNPTRVHFGKDALQALAGELAQVGPVVQLIYGKGSVKRTGLYDQIVAILQAAGKTIVEDAGVMPNPTYEKVKEGCALARAHQVDFLLAVGGGSVCDYAKAVAAGAHCPEDPWEKYYHRGEAVDHRVLPIGCVLTMVGTGSEMNGGSVITNHDVSLKVGHVFEAALYPKFAILNPEWTYTLPTYQMVAGFYDIMCHILEQYLSGEDDSTSDYLAEGLMRS
jgi:alcohol dehydrogenase YqhD (iron-dependent ADH family)